MTHPFIRLTEIRRNLVSLAVPQETLPPHQFRFHHVPYDQMMASLERAAETSDGIYTFPVQEGVLKMFETVALSHSEFGWSFASSRIVDILTAVRVGQTLDVRFDTPFGEVYRISRYHFPSGTPDSGYGQYRIHITEDVVRPTGFRVISSFEEGQELTLSRLPFFFGFRVYGSELGVDPEPVWRSLLGLSIRYCQEEKWHLSVLHSAFCLESLIDTLLKQKMLGGGLPEDYIDHVLRVGEKRDEFLALNELVLKGQFSTKEMNKRYDQLNSKVFKKRNQLAHGKTPNTAMGQDDALEAIRSTVSFIWDFGQDSRRDLLITTGPVKFEEMIDDALIESCKRELMEEAE